jgi:hypothetical protein
MNDPIFSATAILAYHATHALDQGRIQALIRARDWLASAKLLTECGYTDTDGSVDEIIEQERRRAYNMFKDYSTDPALTEIMEAFYKFRTAPTGTNSTLADAETELKETLVRETPRLGSGKAKDYFNTYITAWSQTGDREEKRPEELLWRIAHGARFDLEGIGPLFFWYAYKQTEFVAVRIILTGKRFGYDRERIMENLRRIYDRFK